MVFIAAFVPLIVGQIWYHPKLFGHAWQKSIGLTAEQTKITNVWLQYGVFYMLAVLVSAALLSATIHQMGIVSLFIAFEDFNIIDSENRQAFNNIMDYVGNRHRTFGHGVYHGTFVGVLVALPILATIALFEKKSWAYIWVNALYWIVSMALMGGIISQFV